jgi:hypothetical protein
MSLAHTRKVNSTLVVSGSMPLGQAARKCWASDMGEPFPGPEQMNKPPQEYPPGWLVGDRLAPNKPSCHVSIVSLHLRLELL